MNYPHVNAPNRNAYPPAETTVAPERKVLTMEEKIDKIFFRTSTIEKDVARLLHAQGLESTNKFLNQN